MSIFDSIPGFRDRFWYWRGASGKRYIHSIYSPQDCPPLPGAIYLTVRKTANNKRRVVEIGRFEDSWDHVAKLGLQTNDEFNCIDEIHVHLLAKSEDNAQEVAMDLEAGIGLRLVHSGFAEEPAAEKLAQTGLFDCCEPTRLLVSA